MTEQDVILYLHKKFNVHSISPHGLVERAPIGSYLIIGLRVLDVGVMKEFPPELVVVVD